MLVEPKRPFKFTIIQWDIDNGVRGDPMNCALGRCFQRMEGPKLLEVRVLKHVVVFTYSGGIEKRYGNTKILREALIRFDATGEWGLPPGTYTLPPVNKHHTCEAMRNRARERRAKGDVYMYMQPFAKKTGKSPGRQINPRLIKLKEMRKKGTN
jgi:hypothetical protein